jgi:hypothetical protein
MNRKRMNEIINLREICLNVNNSESEVKYNEEMKDKLFRECVDVIGELLEVHMSSMQIGVKYLL